MRSYLRLAVGCLALAAIGIIAACQAHAEGIPEAKTWSPYTPPLDSPPPEASAVRWYVGIAGAYAWVPEEAHEHKIDDTWAGGIVGGFLWRYGTLGMGVEGDYMVRDLGHFTLDDGVWSLRGRLGVFLTEQTFVYGTAGIAQAIGDLVPDGYDRGLVVGGGIEREIAKGLALRLEALHYRHGDDYVEWGDHGSTAVRAGVLLKF